MLQNTTEVLLNASKQFTFLPSGHLNSDHWTFMKTQENCPVQFNKKSFLDYRFIRPNSNASWVQMCQLTGDNSVFILSGQLTCLCVFEIARSSAGHRLACFPFPGLSPDHPGRQRQWPVVGWQPSAWLQSQRSAQFSPYVPSCMGDSNEDRENRQWEDKGTTVPTPLSYMHYKHLFPCLLGPQNRGSRRSVF